MKVFRLRVVELPIYTRCGVSHYVEADSIFPKHFIWNGSSGNGKLKVSNASGKPIKIKIFKAGSLEQESPYIGDPAYQAELDDYTSNNYLPNEQITQGTVYEYNLPMLTSGRYDVKLYCPLRGTNFDFLIDCM